MTLTRPLFLFALLTATLTNTPWAHATPPGERAARLSANLDREDGRIVQIDADAKAGVWALTRDGTLYHCLRITTPQGDRLRCIGRNGPVSVDY